MRHLFSLIFFLDSSKLFSTFAKYDQKQCKDKCFFSYTKQKIHTSTMEVEDRLHEFIQYQRITIKDFEIKIGTSMSTVNRFVNKKGTMGVAVLKKIATVYPQLNMDWLINGRGSMIYKEPDQDAMIKAAEYEKELNELRKRFLDYTLEYNQFRKETIKELIEYFNQQK